MRRLYHPKTGHYQNKASCLRRKPRKPQKRQRKTDSRNQIKLEQKTVSLLIRFASKLIK